MKKHNIYTADFETRASEQAKRENKTWVWAWAVCCIDSSVNPDWKQVETGNDIGSFFDYIKQLGRCTLYFHNLKFDGVFILNYLLKHGFKHREEVSSDNKASEHDKCFETMISESGVFYSMKIRVNKRCIIEIRDSMKKLPFSVDRIAKSFHTKYQKLELDYSFERMPDYVMTPEETEYLKNDVRVVAEVIETMYDDGLQEMTIGSDCLKRYKKIFNGKNPYLFRNVFPELDAHEDNLVRKAYKGGWCYVNPKYQGVHLKQAGSTYDVNSLYPSMMHSNEYMLVDRKVRNYYPYGKGEYFKGKPNPTKRYPLFVVHFKANFRLREGFLPLVQIKNSFRFAQNEYVINSDGVQELYMTSVDFELFHKHYITESIQWLDGYLYMAHAGMFDRYINQFMEQKINGKGAVREEAKLFLNNLYGKFAQRIELGNKLPYLEDDVIHYTKAQGVDRKPIYVPVGAFITAYSRRFTIEHAQANYDIFCYADTDSIHCVGKPKYLQVHDSSLSCWKHECNWTEAKFLRQKTYVELVDGIFDVKCAGLPKKGKDVLTERLRANGGDLSVFDVGLEIEKCKLVPKTVEGGVILVERDFRIH